ncbi:MAG: alanine racemase, partial [Spirochaetes bacterium]
GYADGYSRAMSNCGEVLIAGKLYPVAGRVCMDQTMINLGKKTDIQLYDEVTLFGPNPAGPDAEELADITGTISYEITCGISARVPRVYI